MNEEVEKLSWRYRELKLSTKCLQNHHDTIDVLDHRHYLLFRDSLRSIYIFVFFFSSRRRHTRSKRDWRSDVCSSDLSQTGRRFRQGPIGTASRALRQEAAGHSCGGALAAAADESGADNGLKSRRRRPVPDHARRSEERRVGKESWWGRGAAEGERSRG